MPPNPNVLAPLLKQDIELVMLKELLSHTHIGVSSDRLQIHAISISDIDQEYPPPTRGIRRSHQPQLPAT
ncbi:hypothetical protein GCM10015535_44260 [Streptomyces gelaticus]|uniref:Uncharacterized protein n=1 Tax=Streptomyces gelaticus TaxID=285446 RepID=A0ABQ2W251_9ACTN|nr:hypothetical protein GCM10015535_44260 [Streptomyces gelaticus]